MSNVKYKVCFKIFRECIIFLKLKGLKIIFKRKKIIEQRFKM